MSSCIRTITPTCSSRAAINWPAHNSSNVGSGQHHAAVGIVTVDQRQDAAADHLDAPLATGSAHGRHVADREVERPHRARANGDLVRPGGNPALEDSQPHRAGETLETHRADLADRGAGTAEVDLATVHRLDAGDPRFGSQPLADIALFGRIDVDEDVPRLPIAFGVSGEADDAGADRQRPGDDGGRRGEHGERRHHWESRRPATAGEGEVGADSRDRAHAERRGHASDQ